MSDTAPGRYDPLPDLSQMPAWVWRRLPRPAKLAVAAAPVAGVAVVLALAPGIDRAKDERTITEAQRTAQLRAERVQQVRAQQRPRFAAGAPAGSDPVARRRLLTAVSASVLADARRRVADPILRVACEPVPPAVGANARYGRYECLAVTHDVAATARSNAAATGYPYRVRIDFDSGRYGYCSVVPRAGEAMIGTQPVVPLSSSCGGR
jgi:hypothetical protein